jgi:hypothetical protein
MPVSLRSEALTTLANLKESLEITDTSQDDRLSNVINRITLWLENETHRKLKARNYNNDNNTKFNAVTSEDYLYFDGDYYQVNERGYGVLTLPVPVIPPTLLGSSSGALTFELAYLSNGHAAGANGASDVWDTSAYTEGQEYVVDYRKGKVTLLAGRFVTGFRNYRVKCTAGFYDATSAIKVPEDLEQLCIELCKQMYRESTNVQSESIGSWSKTYKPDPDPFTRDTISLFTLPSL